MNKKLKLLLGIGALSVFGVTLSACSFNLCSTNDNAQILYSYEVFNIVDENNQNTGKYSFGISTYYDADETKPDDAVLMDGFGQLYVSYDIESNLSLSTINENAKNNNIRVNNYTTFWAEMDNKFLDLAIQAAITDNAPYNTDKATMTYEDVCNILIGDREGNHKGYGYLKFLGQDEDDNTVNWLTWNEYYSQVKADLGPDMCPDSDFVSYYQQTMTGYNAGSVTCIATEDGFYGYYGFDNNNKMEMFIEGKDFNYAWNKGFFEGLLVYPIGWLIDQTATYFMGGVGAGWAQILAILVVTFLIRAIMMIFTLTQTINTQKMTDLQPEIAKIQAKYPNANTNRSEQQSLAMETSQLYKKNKVHPFIGMIFMIIQFPVFLCVWGAMSGASILASNEFLGLRFSQSVQEALFNIDNWPNNPGWWTALVLFIIMALLQVFSMLLPQFIQKRRQKKIPKTLINNNMNKQNKMMKWFTIIMVVIIIIMGFSLASGMVVYWIAGSIWAIAQTLILELIRYLRDNKKHRPSKPLKKATNNIVVDAEVIPQQFVAPTGKKKYKDKIKEVDVKDTKTSIDNNDNKGDEDK